MPGLEKLSDAELDALEAGDLSKLSDAALDAVEAYESSTPQVIASGSSTSSLERFGRGLIGQEREKGFTLANLQEETGQNAGPMAGASIGAATGAAYGVPFGPVGIAAGTIIGAGVGAFGGRMAQTGLGNVANVVGADAPYKPLGQATKEAAVEGGLNAAFAGIPFAAKGAGALAKAGIGVEAGPLARKAGAQILRAGPAIPEKYGEAMLKDMSILTRAQPRDVMSKSYQAFQNYTGLKGLDEIAGERAKAWTAGELYETALTTANNIKSGAQVSPQELYTASQAENQLNRLARAGNPDAMAMRGAKSLEQAGKAADEALEKIYPEYKGLRKGLFESKVREQIGSALPLNKNTSPNVLRTWSAGVMAARAMESMNPLGLVAAPFVSPAAWGLGLRGAYAASKVVPPIARSSGAAALQQYYMRQPATP